MSVVAQGTITERDYIVAQFLHLRPRRAFAMAGGLLVVGIAWTMFSTRSVLLLAILLYFAAYFALFIPWRAKRYYRLYQALPDPIQLETRSDGIVVKSPRGEVFHPWSHVLKWRESNRLLLVYPAPNLFFMVPTHFFQTPEQRRAFIDALQTNVGNAV